ncbi:hypothetical protein GCM10022222_15800 [Amycolatopsis ultiminotia]|uniref:Uncharacterized protein n=1 Tax=Amycolatopsis ultiminotia TaxID=543629 RepID=A0ABP6VEC9_9PSEU
MSKAFSRSSGTGNDRTVHVVLGRPNKTERCRLMPGSRSATLFAAFSGTITVFSVRLAAVSALPGSVTDVGVRAEVGLPSGVGEGGELGQQAGGPSQHSGMAMARLPGRPAKTWL